MLLRSSWNSLMALLYTITQLCTNIKGEDSMATGFYTVEPNRVRVDFRCATDLLLPL